MPAEPAPPRRGPTQLAVVVGVAAAAITIVLPGTSAPEASREEPDAMTETRQADGDLPMRAGPKPRTTDTNPHTQLDQIAPVALQEALARHMFGRACVEERPSRVSVPGARAMWIPESCGATADRAAFMVGREHAHLHPPSDGSLHLALPPALAAEAISKGWAELHPIARRGLLPPTIVMLFGPRDEAELEVVKRLVDASFTFAHGPGATAP